MSNRLRVVMMLVAATALFGTIAALPVCAGDWPQFRGPSADGHVPDSGYPLTWSETENIAWKTAVPGLGWSSPVVVGEQVWLTTAVDEGKSLRAVCVDRSSGKIVHDVEVFTMDDPGPIHKKNSHASPTPIVEGDRLYLHFGAHGTACITTAGKIVWRTNELHYEHKHGPAGSPVIYGDLLIFSCDGTDVQFVVALDKRTGAVRWRQDRKGRMAYSTPLLTRVGGQEQLISTGGNAAIAYEPATGKELWRCKYDGYSLVPRPVVGHGLVFICTGYDRPTLIAVRLGDAGDVTESNIVWKLDKAAPHNPSPLLLGDELYLVSDKGIATCLDARTGKELWQQRIGGNYSASLSLADDRIYISDEDGKTTVIAPGPEFRELAVNQLDGRTLASLAFADRAIYLRTDTHLYRIECK